MIVVGLVAGSLAGAVPAGAQTGSGDPIMPLDEVQPGMRCTGYSVVQGTGIASFDVEILEVIGGGQDGARLLVRASGPAVDQTGIGSGFSGSPIYCPGNDGRQKNAGAISETIG